MADDTGRRSPHFVLKGFASTERFRSPQSGSARPIPARDRALHGAALRDQIEALVSAASIATDLDAEPGLQVEFRSFSDVELAFESLPRERFGIELLNVRRDDEVTYATVYVPPGKLAHFEKMIEGYLSERRGVNGQALDHRRLVDTIEEIRAASLEALWTDDPALFPAAQDQAIWWEIWLPVRRDRRVVVDTFLWLAEAQGIRVSRGELRFPERTVLLGYGSRAQLTRSATLLNTIAELRRAKETAEFFDSQPLNDQREWLDDLLARVSFPPAGGSVPHACLLDTGVNNGHPLIARALSDADLHTVDPAWSTDDRAGHGTAMAGVTLVGDLAQVLDRNGPVDVGHRLESVKLLRRDGANRDDPQLHGYLTIEGVARPEVTAPTRARVFGLAITSTTGRHRGRPSAWSAAIDSLAADVGGDGANPRLLVVSGGNIIDPNAWRVYPDSNTTDSIHDPGQAWNALTVGAYTDLIHITETGGEDYQPVARRGGLSPFSTTSGTWQSEWPLKPDVVFEGGNVGKDRVSAAEMASLSLLTTHHQPAQRLFTTTNATSAATALATGMAAQLMAAYPALRPETIRALIVHSASWTDDMRKMFLSRDWESPKSDFVRLVRHCGFGVPDIARARWSVSNSLAMIVEEQLQPFRRVQANVPTLRDMQLHTLPWPQKELEALGDTMVEMRVTLSYFIEPNPSARGHSGRYRYESHALRFDVKRPTESIPAFRSRINLVARDEEEGTRTSGDDSQWLLGKQGRHRGSLHSDIWRGTAADLASRGVIAVYPALGWWKTRTALERYDKAAPYTLIISIRAPDMEVDLYSAVATEIASRVAVEI